MDEASFTDYNEAQHQQGTVVSWNLSSADNSPQSTEEVDDFPDDAIHNNMGSDTQDTIAENNTNSVLYGADSDCDTSGSWDEEDDLSECASNLKRLELRKELNSVVGDVFKIGSFAEHPL